MTTLTIVLLVAAATAVVAAAFALLSRSREASSRLDILLADSAAARGASASLDRRFDELRRSVEERVSGVEQRLVDGQKNLTDHLGASGRLLQDVGQRMGQIYEASQKIEKLAGDVTRLEDLLKPPKLRGALGEAFLEQTLRQVLPAQGFEMQYRFPDNVVVDAAIFVGDRIVPVDSKFPLENFRRAREAAEEADRRRAPAGFRGGRPPARRRDPDALHPARGGDLRFRPHVHPGGGDLLRDRRRRARRAGARRLCDGAKSLSRLAPASLRVSRDRGDRHEGDGASAQRARDPGAPFRSHPALVTRGRSVREGAACISRNTQKQYDEASKALGRFSEKLSGIAEGAEESLEKLETVGLGDAVAARSLKFVPVLGSRFSVIPTSVSASGESKTQD